MNQSITYISNSGFRYKYRCKVSLTIEYFRQWFQLPAGPIDIVQVLRDKTPLLPYPLLKTPDGSVAFAYDPGREIITLYFPFGYKTGEGQEIAAVPTAYGDTATSRSMSQSWIPVLSQLWQEDEQRRNSIVRESMDAAATLYCEQPYCPTTRLTAEDVMRLSFTLAKKATHGATEHTVAIELLAAILRERHLNLLKLQTLEQDTGIGAKAELDHALAQAKDTQQQLDATKQQLEDMTRERDYWIETARCNATNAYHWHQRAETAEKAVASQEHVTADTLLRAMDAEACALQYEREAADTKDQLEAVRKHLLAAILENRKKQGVIDGMESDIRDLNQLREHDGWLLEELRQEATHQRIKAEAWQSDATLKSAALATLSTSDHPTTIDDGADPLYIQEANSKQPLAGAEQSIAYKQWADKYHKQLAAEYKECAEAFIRARQDVQCSGEKPAVTWGVYVG